MFTGILSRIKKMRAHLGSFLFNQAATDHMRSRRELFILKMYGR